MFCQYVLLFLAATSVASVTCWTAVIRNPDSGYVLDGTEHDVKLQPFKRTPEQYWVLLPQMGGKGFYFMNKATGKFLDIEGTPDNNVKVITSENNAGGMKQIWYVSPDDTIMSVSSPNFVLDIYNDIIKPGAYIIVYTKHGQRNQKFQLDYNVE